MKRVQRRVMTRGQAICSVMSGGDGNLDRAAKQRHFSVQEQIVGRKFTRKSKSRIRPVKLKAAEQWMNVAFELGIRGIRREFVNEVRNYHPQDVTTKAWDMDQNYDKNRFDDIKLADKTRVRLKNTPNNEDYIHASYVTVSRDLTYICAQGPLPNTVQEFWIMAIQEEANVILQLCQNEENNRQQCAEYFPSSDTTEWKEYGAVRVRIIEPTSPVITLKKVARTKIEASYSNKVQEVVHVAYTGWPDHFAAESPSICREVYNLVHKYCGKKPIIVHCSAGIGRTGTFVAVEMVMEKLRKQESCSVADVGKKLRDQRLHAIQNDLQYVFIYRMVVELSIAEDLFTKDQQVIDFIKDYEDLVMRKAQLRKKRRAKND